MSPAKKSVRPVTGKKPKKQRGPNAASAGQPNEGAPFNEQDTKRRLGNFVTAGEHARQGGRSRGIIGQSRQKTRTDKGTSKRSK